MTRDSEGERPQKTVAELLAQHGGQVGGASRRRRRRAADDDDAPSISDTAPQAIIDRVRAEGPPPPGVGRRNGAAPAPPPPAEQTDEAPPARGGRPPRVPPPPQGTGGYPVPPPPAPEDGGRPLPARGLNGTRNGMPVPPAEAPQGRPQARRGPQEPPASDGTLSARLDGLEGNAETATGERPARPGTGAFPVPPRRRRPPRGAPPPPPEPSTEQFPAVAAEPDAEAPLPDEPPAGLAGWRRRRKDAQNEDTEVGVMPVVPPAPPGPAEDDDEGPPTGFYTPNFDDDDEDDGQDGRYRAGLLEDDPLGEQGPHDPYAADYEDDYAYDEHDDHDERAARDLGEDEEAASPAKQWLALAGQLALGVAGGAAVWLGFNWLWGQLPAAALIAALLVTVGLVWIVRKVRRAEDLQTTVLALLVGLVVTVSPAALLLVSR
ncbi:hypothetical protein [Prauserella flavalba]|uniref:hypothetical protein n=1 Tax=Prauserella flavalba TaxID=1477506 RepID=UPI0036E73837